MSDWLDGPKFVNWLERADDFSGEPHGTAIKRRVTEWRAGAPVSIWSADHLLTRIGLHLSQVPDELWIAGRHRTPAPARKVRPTYSKELREALVARVEAGDSLNELSIATGISERTIQRWTLKSKQKDAR